MQLHVDLLVDEGLAVIVIVHADDRHLGIKVGLVLDGEIDKSLFDCCSYRSNICTITPGLCDTEYYSSSWLEASSETNDDLAIPASAL